MCAPMFVSCIMYAHTGAGVIRVLRKKTDLIKFQKVPLYYIILYYIILYYIILYYTILYYIILYYIILYLYYNSYYLNSVMSGNEGIDMQSDFFIRIRQKNPNQSSTGTSYEQNQGKILFKIVHCTVLLLFRCIRGSTRRTQPRFWALFSNMMTPLMTGRRQTF